MFGRHSRGTFAGFGCWQIKYCTALYYTPGHICGQMRQGIHVMHFFQASWPRGPDVHATPFLIAAENDSSGPRPRFRRYIGSDAKDVWYFGDSGFLFRQDGVWAGRKARKSSIRPYVLDISIFRLSMFLNNRYKNTNFCEIDIKTRSSGLMPEIQKIQRLGFKDLLYFGDSGLLVRQDGVWVGAQGTKIFHTCLCFGHFYFSNLARFVNNRYENQHFCKIDTETRISAPRPEIEKIYQFRF